MLHNCHQKFPCSTVWHIWDTFTCSIWVIVSLTSCCVHTDFSPAPPAPALLLHAIKRLHCLSPIALLSIVSSATAEMEKNRMFQVRTCIQLYKGIYRFFCYLLTQLNILFTFFCLLLCSWCSICSNTLRSDWIRAQQWNSEHHLSVLIKWALPLDRLQHSVCPSSGTFAFSQADGSCSQPFSCAYWASSHLHMCCTSSSLALPSARYKSLRWCHIIELHWGEVCPYWRSLYCTLWTFCLMAIAMTSLSSFLQIFD